MSRVSDIFTRVRDKVGDKDGERWDDARLIRLFNDCLDDISIHTKMFRGVFFIPLYRGLAVYDLPQDLIELKKVIHENTELKLRTTDTMERIAGPAWRTRTTEHELSAAVYDEMDVLKLQVFPRPVGDVFTQQYLFEPTGFGFDDNLIGFTADQFGVISNLVDSQSTGNQIDLYGVLAGITEAQAFLVLYTRKAKHITELASAPEVPPVYDKMIGHYIAGMLLRADTSERNRAFGQEELQLYERDLEKASGIASKNKVSDKHHNTSYQGMG